jgi:hypothetical protein
MTSVLSCVKRLDFGRVISDDRIERRASKVQEERLWPSRRKESNRITQPKNGLLLSQRMGFFLTVLCGYS